MALTENEKKKLLDMNEQEIKQRQELNKLSEEELDYLKRIGRIKEENGAYIEKQLLKEAQLLQLYQDQANSIKDRTILAGQSMEVEKKIQRLAEQRVKTGELSLEEYRKIIDASKARLLLTEELLTIQDKFLVSQKEGVEAARQLGKELSGAMRAFQGADIAGILSNITKALQGGKAGIAAFVGELGTGIVGGVINDIFNLVVGVVNMENSFMKATGASIDMANGVRETYLELNEFGVSMEEADAAAQALFTTFTDFTFMSGEQQQVLQQNTAILANYGVAVQDLANSTQIQAKMFGMSGDALNNANMEIFRFSQEIGVAPSQMAADFAASGASLAKFGQDGMQTFKELARLSKITGMEIQKLKQMTDVADTFEGAATQAAKLNAAIGSNMVNAMDLMMATDPAERFDMMTGAIRDAGLSFDEMSYYQRIFYADAMGLNDVSELALVLSGRQDLLSGSTQQSAEDYERLAEESLAVQSIQEQFTAALAENSEEIIGLFGNIDTLIDFVRELPQHFDTFVKTLRTVGFIALGVSGLLLILGFRFVSLSKDAMLATTSMLPLVKSIAASATAMTGFGTASGAAAAAEAALAGSLTTGAGAAGTHAAAITTLNGALAMLEVTLTTIVGISTPYISALNAMAAASTAASAALGTAGSVMKTIIGPVLALGFAVSLVVLSFAVLVYSFKDLGDAAGPAAAGLMAVGASVIGLAIAVTMMTSNPSWYAFMAGLALMAVITAGVTYGLASIGSGIRELAASLSQITNLEDQATTLSSMKDAMSEIASAAQIPENNIFNAIGNLANINLADTIGQVERLVGVVNQTQEAEALAFASAMTAVREAIVTVNAAPAGAEMQTRRGDDTSTELKIDKLEAQFTLDGPSTEKFVKGVATTAVAEYIRQSQ